MDRWSEPLGHRSGFDERSRVLAGSVLLILASMAAAAPRLVALSTEGPRAAAWQRTVVEVNYVDYGFVRRGVIGTAVRLFTSQPDHATVAAWIGLAATMLLLMGVIAAGAWRPGRLWLGLAVVVSPVLVGNALFDVGREDAVVLVLTVGTLLAMRRRRVLLATCLVGAAVLVHEAFLVWGLPGVLAFSGSLRATDGEVDEPVASEPWGTLGRPGVAGPLMIGLVAGGISFVLGGYEGGAAELNERFAAAVEGYAPGSWIPRVAPWTSELGENLAWSAQILRGLAGSWMLPALGLVVLAHLYVLARIVRRRGTTGTRPTIRDSALVVSPLSALGLSIIGVDIYRWGALAGSMALLLALNVADEDDVSVELRDVWPVLLLVPLGPIGVSARLWPEWDAWFSLLGTFVRGIV